MIINWLLAVWLNGIAFAYVAVALYVIIFK